MYAYFKLFIRKILEKLLLKAGLKIYISQLNIIHFLIYKKRKKGKRSYRKGLPAS